ncbi:hypothetical protein B0T26DRAFT_407630 [Lasiosphaeria miniovina]|uniref:Uncharacterized protein n=1 Tax=Lasiosphaeria miniovina TaxID=1954250 RepID=A0AA40A523_9PEZI|nr:uncharacterized protein B0T26DRAFT_407630 [Lasiosphaeria miniovina]KAK0709481.1 hypothetical protein B0T26DRAFT_407630 [Lasiosphaeria miniovina]
MAGDEMANAQATHGVRAASKRQRGDGVTIRPRGKRLKTTGPAPSTTSAGPSTRRRTRLATVDRDDEETVDGEVLAVMNNFSTLRKSAPQQKSGAIEVLIPSSRTKVSEFSDNLLRDTLSERGLLGPPKKVPRKNQKAHQSEPKSPVKRRVIPESPQLSLETVDKADHEMDDDGDASDEYASDEGGDDEKIDGEINPSHEENSEPSRRTVNGLGNRSLANSAPRVSSSVVEAEGEGAAAGAGEEVGEQELGNVDGEERDQGDSLVIEAPATTDAQFSVEISRKDLGRMDRLMGRPGWTGMRKTWKTSLLPFENLEIESEAAMLKTGLGGKLYSALFELKGRLDGGRSATSLAEQNTWLRREKRRLSKPMSAITRTVTRICEADLVAGSSVELSDEDLESRRLLVEDMVGKIIPMLVLILSSSFDLGGVGRDIDDGPPNEGTFTASTMQYLVQITGWLNRLVNVIKFELSQRPLEDESSSELTPVDIQKLNEDRKIFGELLKNYWYPRLKKAEKDLKEKQDEEKLRAERVVRDEIIKTQREQQEYEELAKTGQRWARFEESTHQLKRLPRPAQEIWRKANQPTWSSYGPGLLPSSGRPHAVPYNGFRPIRNEDKRRLLRELRRENRLATTEDLEYYAGKLRLDVAQVLAETELLKMAARDLARQNNIRVEAWAR